jgi:response regulator of citrate/malate metabolism
MSQNQNNTLILCIDDEAEICYALKTLFRTQNWNTVTANSVESGLSRFRAKHPDIVLIDYHMPGVNGVEGVRQLRRLSKTVPIIVFTIDESQEVVNAFLEAGASDFALKPIKAPDIISRIKLHLRLLDQSAYDRPRLAKGISETTIGLIVDYLSGNHGDVTANEIATATGLAYQTVFRYLQYMTQENLITVKNVYGKVGRPKQVYRLL